MTCMSDNKIKVLYTLAFSRSGTTLLSRVLGQIEGFFTAGELYYLWEKSIVHDRMCGCGVHFHECEVWEKVFKKAYGGFDGMDGERMVKLRDSFARTRHNLNVFRSSSRLKALTGIEQYLGNLEKLYLTIAEVTGSLVIVDSSKFPTYANILRLIPSIELHIVHLIRDSRAVAYSWQKLKKQPDWGRDDIYMDRLSPGYSAILWDVWNITGEYFRQHHCKSYTRMRYEDFIRSPQDSVKQIIEAVGETGASVPFVSENEIELGVDHTVSGNPNRFDTGITKLVVDDKWKRNIKSSHRLITTAITLPLLKRYGFPVEQVH